jgi:hypothetical protein
LTHPKPSKTRKNREKQAALNQKLPAWIYLFYAGTSAVKEINFEFYPQLLPSLLGEGPGVG